MPNSKVNVLNTDTLPEFTELMNEIRSIQPFEQWSLHREKKNNFIAGADISMLNTVTTVAEGVASLSKDRKP